MALQDMEIEYMTPRATYWLRTLSGTTGWTEPCAYTAPAGILPGELGAYRGVRVVEISESDSGPQKTGWDT